MRSGYEAAIGKFNTRTKGVKTSFIIFNSLVAKGILCDVPFMAYLLGVVMVT